MRRGDREGERGKGDRGWEGVTKKREREVHVHVHVPQDTGSRVGGDEDSFE